MDITIQMRSLELLIKMLKRDMEGIPAYGYTRQMGSLPLLSARESCLAAPLRRRAFPAR